VIINGRDLVTANPVTPMVSCKVKGHGVSYGLGEAGYDVRINQAMWLSPFRKFRLASTFEYFKMPTNLVAVVHDKSTWARRGLSVFNTVIEPGWKGWLTLELVYHGWGFLYIPKDAGIAQVLFHELSQPAAYEGKYQDQENKPVPPRLST
jgi:dCTP deaminase